MMVVVVVVVVVIAKIWLLLHLLFVVLASARLLGEGQLGIPEGQGEPG